MGDVALNLLVGAVIAVGLVGVVIPALPGVLLVWAAVLVWTLATDTDGRWVVFGLVTALAAASQILKFGIPGRRLQAAGIPTRTLLLGVGLGIVGLFVIPIVGAPVGFVLGVYLAESGRLGSHERAWPSTKAALQGALLSILIEFVAAALCAAIWLAGAIGAF